MAIVRTVIVLLVFCACSVVSKPAADLLEKTINKLHQYEHEKEILDYELNQFTSDLARIEQKLHTGFLGFLALPMTDEEYEQGQRVMYERVLTNAGNHYNPTTSTFTCPVSGYYYFSVSVLCESRFGLNDEMFGAIYVGNYPQIRATAKGRENNVQGHNAGVLYCYAGQFVAVYVETSGNGPFRMVGSNESSFSGFLIYEGPL